MMINAATDTEKPVLDFFWDIMDFAGETWEEILDSLDSLIGMMEVGAPGT